MLANNRKKSFQLKNLQLSNFLIAFTVRNVHSAKGHLRMNKHGRLLSPTSPIKTLHTSHLLICLRSPRENAKCSLERDTKVNHYGVKKNKGLPAIHHKYIEYTPYIDTL